MTRTYIRWWGSASRDLKSEVTTFWPFFPRLLLPEMVMSYNSAWGSIRSLKLLLMIKTTWNRVILLNRLIAQVGRVFANGPGDLGSIPGRVIPKTLKWYLMPPCLTLSNTRYVSRVRWSNPRKGVELSPTTRCSSY